MAPLLSIGVAELDASRLGVAELDASRLGVAELDASRLVISIGSLDTKAVNAAPTATSIATTAFPHFRMLPV